MPDNHGFQGYRDCPARYARTQRASASASRATFTELIAALGYILQVIAHRKIYERLGACRHAN